MDKKEKIKNVIINNASNFPEYSAQEIVKFFIEEDELDIADKKEVLDFYISALNSMNEENLFERQVKYALKLMKIRKTLMYEEVHKLFSLFDNIYCLNLLGFNLKGEGLIEYEMLKNDFILNKAAKVAKLVSEDRFEEWKGNWWWYRIS